MNNPWAAIEKPATDLNVRLVDETHPLKLFWGVDPHSRYSFAYDAAIGALPQKRSLPNLSEIGLYIAQQGSRGKLVLLLQNNTNWEIFHVLCLDLLRATATVNDEATGSGIILRRLLRWQELLKKSRLQILALEEIKGLIGELLFLKNILVPSFGWDNAITAWRGPEGSPQDFSINEAAFEVKCQAGGSRPVVRITSAEQLCPLLPVGHLVVYTLARQADTESDFITLNSIVATIRDELMACSAASRERFEDLLYLTGFMVREEYEEFRFSVVSLKCFKIADGFPRILTSTLIPGVESVSYSILLESCSEFQSTPLWWPPNL